MIHHIVMWSFLEQVSAAERPIKARELKEAIEGLIHKVPGVLHLQVEIAPIGTSTHDLLLVSSFESEAALAGYQVHPDHVVVAHQLKAVAANRACFDYEH